MALGISGAGAYQPDEVQVRLHTREEVVGKGIEDRVTVFDGNAHDNYYQDHFFVKIRDRRYTYPEDMTYRWVRVRSLGGKTNCWAAGTLRLGPIERKPYSYDGVGVDWPISYEEMERWYARTERLIGVSGERSTQPSALPTGEYLPPPPSPVLPRSFVRPQRRWDIWRSDRRAQ
jgi:choline dehydrogenase-like flavoprotein